MNITVLNANLWLLPPPASVDNNSRISNFINLVKDLQPDVVNLQEVWLRSYVDKLKKSLKGYHIVAPRSTFLNKSGLVTFLKHKPVASEFHQFEQNNDFNPLEKIAAKGFLVANFYKEGKFITIINTHVYETIESSKIVIKLEQVAKVFAKAKEHNPTIIAGDLNLEPHKITHLLKSFISEETLHETYTLDNAYSQKSYNQITNKNGVHYAKPDYILINMKDKRTKIYSKPIKDPLVSDHYPLFATIEFPAD